MAKTVAKTMGKWKVVVPAEYIDWQAAKSGTEWKEAPDDIFPGYKARRYDSEPEALAAARQIRGKLMPGTAAIFLDAATAPADD